MMMLTFRTDGAGLTVECTIKPEIGTATDTEAPPDLPPAGLACCPATPASTSSPSAA
jgi:hypothetical protein